MKQLFLLFGLSAISIGTNAQQHADNHTGDKFGVSVFTNSHFLRPAKRADVGVQAKLAAKFPGWYIATDRWTGGFKDLNGKPIAVGGSTLEEKARNIMNNQLAVVNIKGSEWKLQGQQTNQSGITYLYFYQEVAGMKVAFTKMHFRFTADGQLARVNMTGYGAPDPKLNPTIGAAKALEIASAELDGAVITSKNIEADLEWFPIPSNEGYTLHPAFKFSIEGKVAQSSSVPLNMFGYVDGVTGELLYRDNETKDATDLTVVGSIYTNGILSAPQLVGLPNLTGKIGATTLISNDTGFFNGAAFAAPSTYNVSLEGPWSKVRSAPDANITPSFSKVVTSLGTSDSFTSATKSSSRHINAYYHVNTVHDFMKSQYGSSFTGMDYALTTNVDVSGTCNAFFTGAGGSSINFFPAGGGCISFAEVRDVVYHEYGHAIVSKMYSGGMKNGGLNEGQADVWSMCITKDSIMARGSNGTPGSFIRRYDIDPKVYPKDLTGEVHANGEIIAGAWWDYARNVGNYDTMAKLFAAVLLNDKPDGPNGTEGAVYLDMLISSLIEDDNDADLSTGTPHMNELVKAFAKHGIYLLQDVDIIHTEIAHQPSGKAIDVNAQLVISNPVFFNSLSLVYRTKRSSGFVWNSVSMVDAGGFNFSAQIPAQSEGTIVDYYFSAKDMLSNEGVFFPYNFYPATVTAETKSNINYQFGVGITAKTVVDFETTLGSDWQLGISTDNATAGKWIQAVPVGSYLTGGILNQTDKDHTSGSGKCLVTGNASSIASSVYSASVKNGTTTVLTPFFDLTAYKNPIVEYYRWYGNNKGNFPNSEIWRVQMSTGSLVIYKDVENTNQSDFQWRRKMFKPFEVYPAAPKMQLKFVAIETPPSGASGNGLVEAAVDDFVIYEGIESPAGIKEIPQALASIYPNPTVGQLNIVLPSSSLTNVSISFYDLSGKEVSTVPVSAGGTHYSIDTKGMIPGQYLLVLKMDKTIQTHKITVKN